jgi:hypothetical protein
VIEGISSGEVRLDVDLPGSTGLYLKSITVGSQDLMRDRLRLEEGAEVTGVRITIATGVATLAGQAQFKEKRSPAAGSGILLVRADPKLWHLQSARVFALTDAAGQFTLKCAPGEYLVFTWPPGNPPLQSIEEFVRSQGSSARRISLQSKEEKQIELTVTEPQK